ncbi:hypothetical protein C7B69_26280 [filamentous cyanobacterium Phorm 46]|nr:hypothetical protein C7B69_26280 [filamentous cyanobacterium Phorm 46]PSB53640.1 hypothetical protein C7B67_02405 [filamentous cyanobacterium Phorm 6]
MSTQEEIKNAITRLTFLQRHIENFVKQSFGDLSFQIEVVVKDLLNVLENADYVNVNTIKHNHPAIDLLDQKQGIAIQVTTDASMTKVKHTLKMYEKHSMAYKKLIILGFIKKTNAKSPCPLAKIVGIEYLLDKIKSSNYETLQKVNDILQREIPLHLLNPIDDNTCLGIVLGVIDRSAVRDLTRSEGNYSDMVVGLKEIKEVIHNGKIYGKSIRAKSLSEYQPDIREELEQIEFSISKIIQIYNIAKNQAKNQSSSPTFICLDSIERQAIDDYKQEIAALANQLAKDKGIKREIKVG